ncbi:MAG: hypothetical protein H0W72_05120 [Planctomycetes bacterium]|nr:hypothetical protein [Planctomycetota bacterium]
MAQQMDKEAVLRIVIGGRVFSQQPTTFEQDLFVMDQAEIAGLGSVAMDLTPDEKDITAVAKAVVLRAYRSGALFLLLAALLVEEGTEWSQETAKANAEFFRHISDPADKRALQPALAGAVLAFFESGADFSAISHEFTAPQDGVEVTPKKTGIRPPRLVPAAAGALFDSLSGSPSSVKSPSRGASRRKPS